MRNFLLFAPAFFSIILLSCSSAGITNEHIETENGRQYRCYTDDSNFNWCIEIPSTTPTNPSGPQPTTQPSNTPTTLHEETWASGDGNSLCEPGIGENCENAHDCKCLGGYLCDPRNSKADANGCVSPGNQVNCPQGATAYGGQCYCKSGYEFNADRTACVIQQNKTATKIPCIQRNAMFTTSGGCKVSNLCPNACTGEEFQIQYPVCKCFKPNYGDDVKRPAIAFLVQNGRVFPLSMKDRMEITEDGIAITQIRTNENGQDITDESSRRIVSRIQTGLIVFASGAYFRPHEDTIIEMDVDGFFLRKGGAFVKVEHVQDPDNKQYYNLEVKTDTLVAGITGTAFEIWSNKTSEGINLYEGTVNLQYPDGIRRLVAGSNATYDKAKKNLEVRAGDGKPDTAKVSEETQTAKEIAGETTTPEDTQNTSCCAPAATAIISMLIAITAGITNKII